MMKDNKLSKKNIIKVCSVTIQIFFSIFFMVVISACSASEYNSEMMIPTETVQPIVEINVEMADLDEIPPGGGELFNPPEEMKIGETEMVEVRLIPSPQAISAEEAPDFWAIITGNQQGPSEPILIDWKIGKVMSAKLIGEDFDITLLSEEEQFYEGDNPIVWAWDITPLKSGENSLALNLSIHFQLEGVGKDKLTLTVPRTVIVRDNPGYAIKEFLTNYYQWIIPVIAVPLLTWFLTRFYSKERRPQE